MHFINFSFQRGVLLHGGCHVLGFPGRPHDSFGREKVWEVRKRRVRKICQIKNCIVVPTLVTSYVINRCRFGKVIFRPPFDRLEYWSLLASFYTKNEKVFNLHPSKYKEYIFTNKINLLYNIKAWFLLFPS